MYIKIIRILLFFDSLDVKYQDDTTCPIVCNLQDGQMTVTISLLYTADMI